MSHYEKGVLVLLDGLEIDLPIEIEYSQQAFEPDSLEYQGSDECISIEDVLLNGVSIIEALNDLQIKAIESRLLDNIEESQYD